MKFIGEKQWFLTAVTTASRASAARSPIAVLEGLLLCGSTGSSDVEITGYDLKKGIRTHFAADVKIGGRIVLSAKVLGDILRKLPDGAVSVECEDNGRTVIKGGRTAYEMQAMDAGEYPELPEVEGDAELKVPRDTLVSMIDETIFSLSDNESRPIYTGALFETEGEDITIVALDGFRLALRHEKLEGSEMQAEKFVVPGTALSDVGKLFTEEDELYIGVGSRHISLRGDKTELISRRLEGDFLDYRKSIPSNFTLEFKAERSDLIRCADRVALFVDDRTRHPLRCVFGDSELWIRCNTPMGRAEDVCAVDGDGKGFEIGFNNRYLLEALRAAPADQLKLSFNTSTSPCVIRAADGEEKFLYLVLPVRLRSEE
ncbi:MAG: DNA polymerase III subunit beta [Eubacteriales bacterium]|nr:DNA polymerase III subunit beta [Eubacteriales bacterium]